MKPEDIIRMAREADCGHETMDLKWIAPENLERFAALVAAAEREECAKVCESMHDEDRPGDYAHAIRARGAS